MSTTNTKISNLISTQVPFFVRNDHENFVRFLELYYEYLEQYESTLENGKVVERAKNLTSYTDIDRSIDGFVDKFYDNYLKLIPADAIADKTNILKNVKDFYRARGTEKSIKFLMRILFGEENVEFYYPKRDILRASDGKWLVEKSLKIENVFVNGIANGNISTIQNFKNRKIKGNTSNATAVVERIDTFYEGSTLVNELKISQPYKTFSPGEVIFTLFDENGVTKSLSANIFSGYLSNPRVTTRGTGYSAGDTVTIDSNTGSGGLVIVSSVTSGNITAISVLNGGAGFIRNNNILVSGGGGSGTTAYVSDVVDDSSSHPNSYNIAVSTIELEANTTIGNAIYSNLSSSNVNTAIVNALSFFTYSNTGPIKTVTISTPGINYTTTPSLDAVANTRVRDLGILGKMQIIDGGQNYANGDVIQIINVIGGYGTGAAANVKSVDANGVITAVQFVPVPGQFTGGSGYSMSKLPTANVVSSNGSNAEIAITAILGDGETLEAATESIGGIISLSVLSRGTGYGDDTTLNLASIGDGTAKANITVISGVYTYPGRYINDDGHLSSYNFLEDRDYYQNFSYVVKLRKSIEKYRKALKELIHPAGMKLFGEYLYVEPKINSTFQSITSEYSYANSYFGRYVASSNANGTLVLISSTQNVASVSNVFVEFVTGDTVNLQSGIFKVNSINSSAFTVYLSNTRTGTVSANGGNGNTKTLTGSSTDFDTLNVGDAIKIDGNTKIFYIGAIQNATSLTVTTRLPKSLTGNSYYRIQNKANSNGTIHFYSI